MEKESQENRSESNQCIIHSEDKPYVLSSLKDGDIDYANTTGIGLMDKFFVFLSEIDFFKFVCPFYPNPRKRTGIPLHFLISTYLQLKLHVENAFQNLPYLLNSATLLKTLGFNVGPKDGGFNHKNKKPRLCAADQDTVRKFFKDTDAEKLLSWYNRDVVAFFRSRKVFDPQGIFILDSSLLPLPDNPNYENASWLPLDENKKYVDVSRLTEEERKKLKNTLCYNLTTLLNVGFPDNYFIFSGIHLGPGKESGLTQGEKIIDDFIYNQGKGIIKTLLIDRGFIDGPMITRFKKEYHIDTVFPLRKNMDAYTDAFGIAKLPSIQWSTHSIENDKDNKLKKKIELALVPEVTIWQNCEVPLNVAIFKETKLKEETNEYEINQRAIATTLKSCTATQIYELYYRRTQIEERYDQVKNYWNIYKFTFISSFIRNIVFS